jgi:hypothetical protein
MGSVFSTNAGGSTNYAQNSTIGGVDYFAPTLGDNWMQGIKGEAAQHNASLGRGGGGGGGGGGGMLPGTGAGGWIDKSFEHVYDNPALDLQKAELASKNAHWNSAFGALSGMMGRDPFSIGGSAGPLPEISVGGVFNPQQIDQQVNTARAKADRSTATQSREVADSAIGRGFAPNSPLIAALQTQLAGANIGSKAAAETDIRGQGAQMNATQLLNTQQARQNQYEAAESAKIARARPYFDQQNALIAALASLG